MFIQMKRSVAERIADLIDDADNPEKVVAVLMTFGVEAQKQGMLHAAGMADWFAEQIRKGIVAGSLEQAVGATIIAERIRGDATARTCPGCDDPAPLSLWCCSPPCADLRELLENEES